MKDLKNITTPSTAVCGWPRAWGCVSVGLAALLAGCGNIPNARVNYYLAESSVSIKVVRSVMCDKNNYPVVATTVTPTVVHRADPVSTRVFDLGLFRGSWSDADVKVELFEDGRLKALNASTTGQGEAILKAAATLVTRGPGALRADAAPPFPLECGFIKAQNPDKPITIVYDSALKPTDMPDTRQDINPETASSYYHRNVVAAIGSICAVASKPQTPEAPVGKVEDAGERVLSARQPGWISVDVWTVFSATGCTSPDPALWSGRIPVAQSGTAYTIPIPRPAAFGKQTMGVVFAESGALSSLQYTSTTGAAQALGSVNSLLASAQGDTTAQKALQVKAEADLIAQQQRLVLCMASPKNCSK